MFTREELTVIVQALNDWTKQALAGPQPMTLISARQIAKSLERAIITFMKEEMK